MKKPLGKRERPQPKPIDCENYEKNLKLMLESVRKDLDVMLTSFIPAQLALIKTYFWLNALIFAGIIGVYNANKEINDPTHLYLFIGSLSGAILGALLLLFAIHKTSVKFTPREIEFSEIASIEQDEYEHTNMLCKLLPATQGALEDNRNAIQSTGKFLRVALYVLVLTILVMVGFGANILYINLNL